MQEDSSENKNNSQNDQIDQNKLPTENPEVIKSNAIVKKQQNNIIGTDTNNDQKTKKVKNLRKILLISVVLIVDLIIIFLVIACVNRFNTNVYKNVFFEGKDMSSMSFNQILTYLTQNVDSYNKDASVEVVDGSKSIYTIKPEDIKFELDVNATAKNILNMGRTGNILRDNFFILKTLIKSKNVEPIYKYDKTSMQEVLKNVDLSIPSRYVDDTYSIDEKTNSLVIVKGKSGYTIDYDKVGKDIITLLKLNQNVDYQVSIVTKEPSGINVEAVYNDVKREAKDAYIDKSVTPVKLVKEQVGYDFNKDELAKMLADSNNQKEGMTITFPLQVSEPKVKLIDIAYTLYNDKLSGVTTYFPANQYARSNNIAIALKYLNGIVVMPGQTFSYNKIIGETTKEKGYLPAPTFKGGTVVQEDGGGICQTVSTLYDAALIANMQIVERHQHGLPVGYVKPSLDATVYGDVLDLKFKNTRNYPVKIVTSYSQAGSLNVSIYGTKEEKEYEITLSSKYLYTIPFTTTYTYDNSLFNTYKQVITNGVNGYASEGYITKKLNGQVVATELLSKDIYKPQQQVMKIGTKAAEQNQENSKVNVY